LIGLLDCTSLFDLLPKPVKSRRAIICAKPLDSAEFPNTYDHVLFRTIFHDQYRGLQTAEFGRVMRGWGDGGDRDTALVVQANYCYCRKAQRRDDSWFILTSSELGSPETVLRDYAAHGDNLSLAVLIHITRQQFSHYWKQSWPEDGFSKVLEAASKFNVQDTLPELQHEFCALWNQIVLITMIGGWRFLPWDRFATFSSLCIEVPILPQHDSPPPRAMGITSHGCRPRI